MKLFEHKEEMGIGQICQINTQRDDHLVNDKMKNH